MRLHTASFSLELTGRRIVDGEDWVRVWAEVTLGVFAGGLEAYLQLEDLRRFKREIELLHGNVGVPGEAVLSGIEPFINLDLKSDRLGSIAGTCKLEDESSRAQLSGVFSIDQSYLPELAASVENLIDALSPSPCRVVRSQQRDAEIGPRPIFRCQRQPIGTLMRSSPRLALAWAASNMRALSTPSSNSLMLPFMPSRRRSFGRHGS